MLEKCIVFSTDILSLCAEFIDCLASMAKDRWNVCGEYNDGLKLEAYGTKLTVTKSMFFKQRVEKGVEIVCSNTMSSYRKEWTLRVRKVRQKDFTFKIGISDSAGKFHRNSYALCIANDSFASSSWMLQDCDIISVLYYGSTLKFAVNGKQYPTSFRNVPYNRYYTLAVQLYDCCEIQML